MDMNLFVLGYLDAGTGSLIFQILVASLVSAGVVFGGAMTQLRSFFSRVILRRRPEEQSVGESPLSSDQGESPLSSDQPVIVLHVEKTPESVTHRKAA